MCHVSKSGTLDGPGVITCEQCLCHNSKYRQACEQCWCGRDLSLSFSPPPPHDRPSAGTPQRQLEENPGQYLVFRATHCDIQGVVLMSCAFVCQVFLVIIFWFSRILRGDPNGPRLLWIRRANKALSESVCAAWRSFLITREERFTPWQLIVSTLTGMYTVRHLDKILGLAGKLRSPLTRGIFLIPPLQRPNLWRTWYVLWQ